MQIDIPLLESRRLIEVYRSPITGREFAEAMASLGPFESAPRLAVGVSGGPDSMALALLAADWAHARRGSAVGVIVDHGLREESAREAAEAARSLASRGIASQLLTIKGLHRGSALAERARGARLAALSEYCAKEGLLHLLLAHHAADQAETVLIRTLSSSGDIGLAGMAPVVETRGLRVLRPLLLFPPARLRATLMSVGLGWAEDPSNTDASALRPRLRRLRADSAGAGSATFALSEAARAACCSRVRSDLRVAACLAERASVRPEGFAVLSPGSVEQRVLSRLIQTIAGAPFPPATKALDAMAEPLRPATLAGVRVLAAGRLGPGFLLAREAAAMASAVPAQPGAIWDGRFRLGIDARIPPGAMLGALGSDAIAFRRRSELPSAVLRTLPAIRHDGRLFAVPHLGYPDTETCARTPILFSPPQSAASAPYFSGLAL